MRASLFEVRHCGILSSCDLCVAHRVANLVPSFSGVVLPSSRLILLFPSAFLSIGAFLLFPLRVGAAFTSLPPKNVVVPCHLNLISWVT